MNNTAFSANSTPEITVRRTVPRMVSIKEAHNLTGLSELFLRRGFRSGELVGVRCGTPSGGKILLNFDKLVDYLDTHTETVELAPEHLGGKIHPVNI